MNEESLIVIIRSQTRCGNVAFPFLFSNIDLLIYQLIDHFKIK